MHWATAFLCNKALCVSLTVADRLIGIYKSNKATSGVSNRITGLMNIRQIVLPPEVDDAVLPAIVDEPVEVGKELVALAVAALDSPVAEYV